MAQKSLDAVKNSGAGGDEKLTINFLWPKVEPCQNYMLAECCNPQVTVKFKLCLRPYPHRVELNLIDMTGLIFRGML